MLFYVTCILPNAHKMYFTYCYTINIVVFQLLHLQTGACKWLCINIHVLLYRLSLRQLITNCYDNCYYLHYRTNSRLTVSLFPAVSTAATMVEFPTIVHTQPSLGLSGRGKVDWPQKVTLVAQYAIMKNWTELLLTCPTREQRQTWQATHKEMMHCEQLISGLDITARDHCHTGKLSKWRESTNQDPSVCPGSCHLLHSTEGGTSTQA